MNTDQNETLAARMRQAVQLHRRGSLREAASLCEHVLRQQAHHFDALHLLGVIHLQSGATESGLTLVDEAIAQRPGEAIAYNSKGNGLLALGRREAALEAFDRALSLQPRSAVSHCNRGNALMALKRHADALVSFERALDLDSRYVTALVNRGVTLLALEQPEEAVASQVRALALDPNHVEGWTNRGNALLALRRPAEALACYERALELRPGFYRARHNLCQALLALNRPDEALAALETVLSPAVKPDDPDLQSTLANAQMRSGRPEEAASTFEKLLSASPEYEYALGSLCDVLLQRCYWRDLPKWESATLASVREGRRGSSPFSLMALNSEPADQLMCARAYVEKTAPAALERSSMPGYRHRRIRVAYLSPDFRDHPVAHQVVRLIETHDRERFEVIGIALEKSDSSEVGQRIRAAFDQFLEAHTLHESDIAQRMRELEIDVAVDLCGHTFCSRLGVFAQRAAPVQVNYLGFPGTTGTACHDYLIADRWVVPEQDEAHYTEAVVRLPHSYQPYDPRPEATRCTQTREEAGLPADAFVFCCFNNRFKFSPGIFDVWTRILTRVPGSVLWLPEAPNAVCDTLRAEAEARGVDAKRIVFAPRMQSRDAHVARYQLADLFLDTLPFNAHATATDALWSGLPLLTCPGRTFAGRVATGMLHAVSLPELIARDLREYEEKAVSLARPDGELRQLRARLVSGRATHALFDLDRYRDALERAYERMVASADAGNPHASFIV